MITYTLLECKTVVLNFQPNKKFLFCCQNYLLGDGNDGNDDYNDDDVMMMMMIRAVFITLMVGETVKALV